MEHVVVLTFSISLVTTLCSRCSSLSAKKPFVGVIKIHVFFVKMPVSGATVMDADGPSFP